jgi:hypothetical protein
MVYKKCPRYLIVSHSGFGACLESVKIMEHHGDRIEQIKTSEKVI